MSVFFVLVLTVRAMSAVQSCDVDPEVGLANASDIINQRYEFVRINCTNYTFSGSDSVGRAHERPFLAADCCGTRI